MMRKLSALLIVVLLAGCATPIRVSQPERLRVVVLLGSRRLDLYEGTCILRSFPIAPGSRGKTPTGSFVVKEKIAEPVWWSPEGETVPYGNRNNPLGSRWISLRATSKTPDVRGYAIHGGLKNQSHSKGCIVMKNRHIEQLYDVLSKGTLVEIKEDVEQ